MLDVKALLRSFLSYAGKGDHKVASVFGVNAEACHRAVMHVRDGAPGVPIWLFTTATPLHETEAICERVFRTRSTLALIVRAQSELWRCWVAISVGTWSGERGAWALKIAPFLIPPFRVLILNRDGGFFSGNPSNILIHCTRAGRDAMQSAWGRARGIAHDGMIRALNVTSATGLLVLATLLRWTFNPHWRLFRRLHGEQPLMLDLEPSNGDEVVAFRQSGTEWDGEGLERLARTSDSRWILWQSGEGDDSPTNGLESFSALFNDGRIFALSQQVSFRGWKKSLFATAPFRALQPGEATRVSAPLSVAILVDRKKLLALGIPQSGMPVTAWLILFWKAAAAGWRSYSVGQNAPLREQADFPVQETAFVLEALRDRALQRLCPRQEQLSRGNIAFAPGLERMSNRDTGRLKVLIVSPFLPYPLSHGGAVRMFNLCRALSDRVDFTLIAVREANDVVDYATLRKVFCEVHVIDKDERPRHDKRLPAQVSASESKSLRALITQLSQRLLPDLIQIEFTHFAGFRDSAPGVPALLVEHDLTFSLYRQLAETNPSSAAWREYGRWLAFERKWLAAYEGVWTVSEEDRERAIKEGGRDAERTMTIANGVDIERYKPCEAMSEMPEVFYVGSFRHLPNIIGFERLCQEIMPRVWAKAPKTRLRVVAGPEHERYWKQFGRKGNLRDLDQRIEVHGFVKDLRPFYARASAVAVPLEVSAGTNIKVLEAMACGKAIVSTPVGCAGLGLQDDYHLAIRQGWEEFADAVAEILSQPTLRHGLGVRARKMVEDDFSWNAIADQAYESYVAVTGKAPLEPAEFRAGALKSA